MGLCRCLSWHWKNTVVVGDKIPGGGGGAFVAVNLFQYIFIRNSSFMQSSPEIIFFKRYFSSPRSWRLNGAT